MISKQQLRFGRFELDAATQQLSKGQKAVVLTRKAAQVLTYLVQRAGQLVTKDELLEAAWPGTVVSDAAMAKRIFEIRKALRDNPRKPRFLQTIHGQGFRFIADIQDLQSSQIRGAIRSSPAPSSISLVGREAELDFLHACMEQALSGKRQIVFVTGEAGIGKTALLQTFAQHLRDSDTIPVWISLGQCVEQFGAGEAYRPILEALGRLCRQPHGDAFIKHLSQHAPSWLVQMPALIEPQELDALIRRGAGVTRERMLREMAEALEVATAERPVVLLLEDLHWCDASSLALLNVLARRSEPARLLIIGTHRPLATLDKEHPLRAVIQELQVHKQCRELSLSPLSLQAIEQYLAVRLDDNALPPGLATLVSRQTEGNPLFMVSVIDTMLSQGLLINHHGAWQLTLTDANKSPVDIPSNVQSFIEQQLSQLSEHERTVLEVASVAGSEFTAEALAACLDQPTETIEICCDGLGEQRLFVRNVGLSEWPNGTLSSRYGFTHILYQDVLYRRLSSGRRARLHKQMGEHQEAGYGEQAGEIAAELAVHFERGRDLARAVHYLHQAGVNALNRNASQEAISLLTKGLDILRSFPEGSERVQLELMLLLVLGETWEVAKGYAAPEVATVFRRAEELCVHLRETPQRFPVVMGLATFHFGRGELQEACTLSEELIQIAQNIPDPTPSLWAHIMLGMPLAHRGAFVLAQQHLEQAAALYDPALHRLDRRAQPRGQDVRVTFLTFLGLGLWMLGYADKGVERVSAAVEHAETIAHPFSLAFALYFELILHQHCRAPDLVEAKAERLLRLCTEEGFPQFFQSGRALKGYALAERGRTEEGLALLRDSFAGLRTAGAGLGEPWFFSMLATAHNQAQQYPQALAMLEEALEVAERRGELYHSAELLWLRGESLLQQALSRRIPEGKYLEAEGSLQQAIVLARHQQAKMYELRATTSLAKLWKQQKKATEARQLLAPVYRWFSEGFYTPDLQEARVLLEELGEREAVA